MSANSANSANFRKRQAILCGVSDYSNLMGGPLPTIEQEIPAIDDVLSNKLYEGYCYKVTSYLNENVTLDDLPTIFAPYKQDSPTDELLFYFSGHGTIYNDEPYFVTYGAASNNPGIKLSVLAKEINSLHPGIKEIFLILDFCHSGSFLEPSNLETINQFFEKRIAALTATRKDQLGETKNQFGKSFADYFVEALTNTLPDKNGLISFGRLALYISEQMQSSYVQSPVFYAHALSGHPINKVNKKILLPHRRNPFFTGRVETLSSIETALTNNNKAVITQAQAISGIGGIGKTQTAIEFCYRQILNNNYQTVLWITAENQVGFNNSYYGVVDLLNLANSGSTNTPSSNDSANQGLKVDEVISLVKRWLTDNPNWLMVLDNLEDPKLIKEYLPTNHQGHILITTRSQSLKGQAAIVQLKKMSPETGTLFLLKRASLIPIDASNLEQLKTDNNFDNKLDGKLNTLIADAQKIVQAMDGLPLALEQAGAYIQESECYLADYLKAYQDVRNTATILDNDGEDANDHKSVYSTFKLNFDVVKEKSVAAAKLLEVCSFLDSELIPEEIFTIAGNFLGDELAKLQDNNYEFNNCLKILLNYSLIERDTNNKSLSIHRLVQTVIRELIKGKDQQNLWLERIVKALHKVFPEYNRKDWVVKWLNCKRLVVNVKMIGPLIKDLKLESLEHGMLLHKSSIYLKYQGSYSEAFELSVLALEITENALGNKHCILSRVLNIHAELYYLLGEYEKTKQTYLQALKIVQQVLGDENSEIATTLNNYGNFLYKQGQHAQAELELTKALNIRKKLLDPQDPHLAATFNNLALVYYAQGKYLESENLFSQAINITETVMGKEHPDLVVMLLNLGESNLFLGKNSQANIYINRAQQIAEKMLKTNQPNQASTLHTLANLCISQEKYKEAEQYYQQAISIKEQLLGTKHPDLIRLVNDFAILKNKQGQNLEAEQLLIRVWNIVENQLPPNHPDFLAVINNLFSFYDSYGKPSQAESFFEKLLNILPTIKNTKHPNVGTMLNNLAEFYRKKGDYAKATPLYEQALEIEKITIGESTPGAAIILENKALLCFNLEKYDESEILFNQTLNMRKQVLSSNHSDVAKTLCNLGHLYFTQERFAEAEIHYEQALKISVEVFGQNHLKVATIFDQLSQVYFSQNKFLQAEVSLQCLLGIREKTLDSKSLRTADTLNNLAMVYEKQDKYHEAETFYIKALQIYQHFTEKDGLLIVLGNLANLYLLQNKYEAAQSSYQQILNIYKHHFGDFHPDVAMTLANIAMLYETTNKELEAADYYKQALSIYDQVFPANHPWIAELLDTYSQLLLKLNKPDEAQPLLGRLASLESSS